MDWEYIVIGAGVSGLSAASILSSSGKKVLVLERNQKIGGRATSMTLEESQSPEGQKLFASHMIEFRNFETEKAVDASQWTINSGFHSAGPGNSGPIESILSRSGESVPEKNAERLFYQSGDGRIVNIYSKPSVFSYFGLFDSLRTLRLANRIKNISDHEIEKNYEVSWASWLEENVPNQKIRSFLGTLGAAAVIVVENEKISAGECLAILRDLENSVPRHPSGGGVIEISKALARSVEKNGGEILTGSPVEEIIIENNTAVGVRTEEKTISSGKIICSVPLQQLPSILGKENLPEPVLQKCRSLVPTVGAGGILGLDERVVKTAELYWTSNIKGKYTLMAWPISEFSPSMCPDGKQMIEVATLIEHENINNERLVEEVIEESIEALNHFVPGVTDKIIWRLTGKAGFINGAAQMIGQSRGPQTIDGLDNLYLVGDTVSKATGIGVDIAAGSALELEKILS